jgi:hypothetical protein
MKYFFELPVYRLKEEDYYHQRDAHIDRAMYPPDDTYSEAMRAKDQAEPQKSVAVRHMFAESYGGAWRFNEIIGYIRLHFLGTQIRGEYFSVSRRRIVRTRTKQFAMRTWNLAPEIEIEQPITNASVRHAVDRYIESCRRHLPKRYVDTETFDVVCKHVGWLALYLEARH